jgi:hypothetical protein
VTDSTVMIEIERAAQRLQVETAALAAVAQIESALRAGVIVNGRREPLIRFEGHYFDRRLRDPARAEARRLGLASPTAGAIKNPPSQEARWRLLGAAAQLDRRAAYEATSWGLGQVMGAHWAWLGYSDIDALVAEARDGAAGQLRLMTRYIDKAGLTAALQTHDWPAFARGYNGPAYRQNGYDSRLARAYLRLRKTTTGSTVLRRGARGAEVAALQAALAGRGYTLRADGIFGPRTEAVVRRFQQDAGLSVDGIAGPATRTALASTETVRDWSLLEWLKNVFVRALRI